MTESESQGVPRVACPLCRSSQTGLFYRGSREGDDDLERAFLITDSEYHSHPDIFRCRECGLIFSDPESETAEPLPYYQAMVDEEYHRESRGRAKAFRRILERLARAGVSGTVLDVGAATGIFLAAAREKGWRVAGVEPSRWAVDEARRRFGLEIFCGTLAEAGFAPESFDAVVLLDVIEHVSDPPSLMTDVNRILTPGGMVVLTTPDIGSPVARLLGARWWHIRRAHQYYFVRESLTDLLRQAGFRIVGRKHYPWAFSLHYWISRLEHFSRPAYRIMSWFERTIPGRRLAGVVIKLNFFDSFELYLRKAADSADRVGR